MAKVFPFAATIPPQDKAEQVAAPPYDVVNTREAAELAEGNPLSFLRVSRPEIELPDGTELYSDAVYEKAKENYQRLKQQAPLQQDSDSFYYIYSLEMNGHRQTGIVAASSVDDYDQDIIKKHEKTRREKEDDRTRHILTLRSQTGPVFLTYRDSAAITQLTESVQQETAPLYDFRAPDGIAHTVWRVPSEKTAELQEAFEQVPYLYIADGHHRAASASRARKECRDQNPDHTGSEPYNRFLTVIFPAGQLQILPYNRVVKDLNGLSSDEFLEKVKAAFRLTPSDTKSPQSPAVVCMYLDGQWYELRYAGPSLDSLSPAERLDVSLLQENILSPVLGIDDPRTSHRIDFVGGIRGTAELEKRVDSGECRVAFSMYPTTVEQLMAIADADEIMPPKSTWFEPKLRDGLLIHDI